MAGEAKRPKRCETCSYWLRVQGDDGECHRNAPSPGWYAVNSTVDNDSGSFRPPVLIAHPPFVLWPPTEAGVFCGDWAPVPPSREELTAALGLAKSQGMMTLPVTP